MKVIQKQPVLIAEVEMMPEEDDTTPKVAVTLAKQCETIADGMYYACSIPSCWLWIHSHACTDAQHMP